MSEQLLRRCPFCGGEGLPSETEAVNREPRHVIRCRSCGCEGGWGKTKSSAVSWWNMRTESGGVVVQAMVKEEQ